MAQSMRNSGRNGAVGAVAIAAAGAAGNPRSGGKAPALWTRVLAEGRISAASLRRFHSMSGALGLDDRFLRFVLTMGLLTEDEACDAMSAASGVGRLGDLGLRRDPRLVGADQALRLVKERLVPWRNLCGVTTVVSDIPQRLWQNRDWLEAQFGPISMALVPKSILEQNLQGMANQMLVARAEAALAPEESCRSFDLPRAQRVGLLLGLLGLGLLLLAPIAGFAALLLLLVVATLVFNGLKLTALWLDLARPASGADPELADSELPVISILVPLFREEAIARHLVRRLSALDYPPDRLDILLVVEEEDHLTQKSLALTDLPRHFRIIAVPRGTVRTKPRAMNYALDFAQGSLVGIYDAEDAPARDQLRRVAARFARRGEDLACIQGILDFYNPHHNWLARCFTIEYAAWFRLLLPGIARLGLAVPLGGTTLFLRRSVIEAVGRWDAHNVTEDADLGVRLYRRGYRTEVMDFVTLEEANARLVPWIKQRSRWSKGFMMTWLVLMRDPVGLWRDLGARRFFGVQMFLAGSVLQSLLAPLYWSFWIVALGLPHPAEAAFGAGGLTLFFLLFLSLEALLIAFHIRALRKSGQRLHWAWTLTMPLYYPIGTLAALKALWEVFRVPFFWDKTLHGGFSAGDGP